VSDAVSVKHAALLISHQTKTALGDQAHRHIDAAKGWYDALSRAHMPVDVILDEEVCPEVLPQYRVLILANATALSDGQVSAVEGFVSAGGRLIATHKTSLQDGEGHFRRGFALTRVLGCEYQAEMDAPWTYIGLTDQHAINDGFDPGLLIMHGEMKSLEKSLKASSGSSLGATLYEFNQLKVTTAQDAEILGTIHDSAKPLGSYFIKDIAPAIPGRDTGYPSIVAHAFAKGSVVYLAGQVDRLFYQIGHPDYERLLLNSLGLVGPPPVVSVKAPTMVETTFYRQPEHNRIIIHLLNHTYEQLFPAPASGQYGSFSREVFRPVGDIIPVRDVEISLRPAVMDQAARAHSPLTSKPMHLQIAHDVMTCQVPELAEYDMIVVDGIRL